MARIFTYGSNMSSARLSARVPSARPVAVAELPAHRLRFHKVGMDGSAKCDAEATGRPDDRVFGVLYDMADGEKRDLDRHEGLGAGYDEKDVEVVTDSGRQTAIMYFATHTDAALKPFAWYVDHVLRGAREHGLPSDYLAAIGAVQAVDDPDSARDRRERAIHVAEEPGCRRRYG